MAVEHVFNDARRALCWATEVALATLEHYRGLSRPSKHELSRHVTIADTLLRACEMHVTLRDAKEERCPRVVRHLDRRTDSAMKT